MMTREDATTLQAAMLSYSAGINHITPPDSRGIGSTSTQSSAQAPSSSNAQMHCATVCSQSLVTSKGISNLAHHDEADVHSNQASKLLCTIDSLPAQPSHQLCYSLPEAL